MFVFSNRTSLLSVTNNTNDDNGCHVGIPYRQKVSNFLTVMSPQETSDVACKLCRCHDTTLVPITTNDFHSIF